MRARLAAIVIVLACVGFAESSRAYAVPDDEIRSAFSRFVDANNAHDLDGVGKLLADSADFLWISRGDVVRERGAALDRFREVFLSSWRIDPDWSTFEALGLDDRTVEVFVRVDISTHAEIAPGTEMLSTPREGIAVLPRKYSGVHAAGERPEALRPWICFPSQMMAKASLPRPLETGSMMGRHMAVASAASTALPPASSMRRPACAASG